MELICELLQEYFREFKNLKKKIVFDCKKSPMWIKNAHDVDQKVSKLSKS